MSLGIVIKGPEGLVLAAESRLTITVEPPAMPQMHVNFDNATKVTALGKPNDHIGFVNYGLAAIGWRTPHSYMPEFESLVSRKSRLKVGTVARRLSKFFMGQWDSEMPKDYQNGDIVFVVGAFNRDEHFGRVYQFEIPSSPKPQEQHAGPDAFGISWGGQAEWVIRLIQGFDQKLPDAVAAALNLQPPQMETMMQALEQLKMQIPLAAMALQDCVDLATFFIRTTISAQQLTIGVRGCGGPIDIATITRHQGVRFVQEKTIVGER